MIVPNGEVLHTFYMFVTRRSSLAKYARALFYRKFLCDKARFQKSSDIFY